METMHEEVSFAEWLANQLERKGWSAARLAKEAGVSKTVISRILQRKVQHPKPETCRAIAEALDVPVETVFRIVRYLPPVQEIPELVELASIMAKLSPESRQEIVENAKIRLKHELLSKKP